MNQRNRATKKEAKEKMKGFFELGAVNQAKQVADALQDVDAGIVTEEHLRQLVNEIDEHLKSSKQWMLEQGNKPPFKIKERK